MDLECAALACFAGDDDLRLEVDCLHGFLVVIVRHDLTALEVLNSQVLDVEPDVHTWSSFFDLFVMHFH